MDILQGFLEQGIVQAPIDDVDTFEPSQLVSLTDCYRQAHDCQLSLVREAWEALNAAVAQRDSYAQRVFELTEDIELLRQAHVFASCEMPSFLTSTRTSSLNKCNK